MIFKGIKNMWLKNLLKKIRGRFHRDLTVLLEKVLKDNKVILDVSKQLRADILKHQEHIKEKILEHIVRHNSESQLQKESIRKLQEQYESLKKELHEQNESLRVLHVQNQSLKEEILVQSKSTKSELYSLMKNVNKVNEIVNSPTQNIKNYLFKYAGMQTAEYIIANMPTTLAFRNNFELLNYALSQVLVKGMYLEFGVYSGKTINYISTKVPMETVFGFDSFEGLPENWRTGFEKGTFKTDSLPDVNSNVVLIQGWFKDTLPGFVKTHNENCAFIHIDCDLYSSTKTIFDNFKNKITPGTIIVFDEYFNYPNWQKGEYMAFQNFIKDTGLKYEYIGYVETHEQVAVRITI